MKLRDPGPHLTAKDIRQFEREIGGRLPRDYKHFLLATNGGWTEPESGFRWNGEIHEVPYFDPLLPDPESGLRRALRNLREYNIEGFLPITRNLDEQDICLAFVEKVGAVSWAMYTYDDDSPVAATLVPLASSFTDFLKMLFPLPVVYCPIVELAENGTIDDLNKYLVEGNSVDAIGKHGMTIICEAIKFNNVPMIRGCIARGASLSETLHMAARNRRIELIQTLLDAGADINEQDEHGDRPLDYVGGTLLPGERGAANRRMRDLLLKLGAVE